MIKKSFVALILISVMILGLNAADARGKSDKGKTIDFNNSGIQLAIENGIKITVYFNKNGKRVSINKSGLNDNETLPAFFAVVDGVILDNFEIDFDTIKKEKIKTEFGEGERLIIKASSDQTGGIKVGQILTVELYKDFPNAAIAYAEFINESARKEITLDTVYNCALQLDASLTDQSLSPRSFYTFYGTDGRPNRQIEKTLPKIYNKNNFNGRPDSLEGVKEGNGGIPVVDLWCKEMGIGIGYIETKWKNLYFPIRVQKNEKVFIAVKEIPNFNKDEKLILKPGESFRTIKTFVNVHTLDFYNTIETYSKLLKMQGLDLESKTTENDYLSAWCSWNEFSTRAMASKKDVMMIKPILQRLPELKELKIGEIIFDAGWFNNQGDWLPNEDTDSFPGGESDLISSIEKIHEAGFKVKLWISYLTADPWSEVAKTHPEWMIKKRDGSYHLDRWSGYTMCPSLPEVQDYHRKMAERFAGKYNADGFKVDGMYVCPPCYNPEHHHGSPDESTEDYYKVFKSFYEGAKSVNPLTTIMACPCGSVCDFTSLPFVSETIAADPKSLETVRRKAKLYRALKGADTPFSSDYIDIVKGNMYFPATLATAVGAGTVPETFYGERPENFDQYKKWFTIYSEEAISKARYLNLYDMHYDRPETHVFEKKIDGKSVLYFSFYEDDKKWDGAVEFRGLGKDKEYSVYDYVNNIDLGIIKGDNPFLNLSFEKYLLVKCIMK